jgi:hypothetical protein
MYYFYLLFSAVRSRSTFKTLTFSCQIEFPWHLIDFLHFSTWTSFFCGHLDSPLFNLHMWGRDLTFYSWIAIKYVRKSAGSQYKQNLEWDALFRWMGADRQWTTTYIWSDSASTYCTVGYIYQINEKMFETLMLFTESVKNSRSLSVIQTKLENLTIY